MTARAFARIRTAHALSQSQLAERIEVNHTYISRIEAGKRIPSRGVLLTMIRVLAVPVEEANVLLLSYGYAPLPSEEPSIAIPLWKWAALTELLDEVLDFKVSVERYLERVEAS